MEERVSEYLERMNFQDWINQQLDTKLLIRQNLIAGIARGLGMALGGTVVLSIVLGVYAFIKSLFF